MGDVKYSKYKCPYCGQPYIEVPPKPWYAVTTYRCTCERFLAEEEADRRREEEADKAIMEKWRREFVDAIGVPKRYMAATPDTDMARDVLENGGLFMVGNVGAGKTHAACAMLLGLADLPNRPQSARFVNMPNLSMRIRSTFNGGDGDEASIMRQYVTCRVLVLDDVGKGKQTDWALEKLFQIVDGRYNEGLPIVVTTQYEWPDLGKRLSACGDPDTAESILSRLGEMCRTVRFDGPDRRS